MSKKLLLLLWFCFSIVILSWCIQKSQDSQSDTKWSNESVSGEINEVVDIVNSQIQTWNLNQDTEKESEGGVLTWEDENIIEDMINELESSVDEDLSN